MSKKAEQNFYETLKTAAPKGWWLQRLENLAGAGIPDLLLVSPNGHIIWWELKAPILPKRDTSLFLGDSQGLNVDQASWQAKAQSYGIPVYTVVRPVDSREIFLFGAWAWNRINSLSVYEATLKSDLKTDHPRDAYRFCLNEAQALGLTRD